MKTYNMPPSFFCPHCRAINPITPGAFESYFKGQPSKCSKCAKDFDWWEGLLKAIKDNFMYTFAFGAVGALRTTFVFSFESNKAMELDFCAYGVPPTARILAVNYTKNEGNNLFPIQWHPNQLLEGQSLFSGKPHVVHLFPIAMGPETGEKKSDIVCAVTWIISPPDDPSIKNLVDAFAAYANKRYADALIPANVAVEVRLSRALGAYLADKVSRKHVEEFLTDAATYSSQLNVVLPLLAKLNHLPAMPDQVRGGLNRLRGLRNELAHQGHLKSALTQAETAELLTAATLGAAYIELFDRSVNMPVKTAGDK